MKSVSYTHLDVYKRQIIHYSIVPGDKVTITFAPKGFGSENMSRIFMLKPEMCIRDRGKTNILEAAYLSGTTKSHKGRRDKEMIRFGEKESHISTVVQKKEKEYQIDMHLRKSGSKGVAVNKLSLIHI